MLARKTGAGAIRRPALVALGAADGKKEVIDFCLAQSESATEWERFLSDLIRRGLVGDVFEIVCPERKSRLDRLSRLARSTARILPPPSSST